MWSFSALQQPLGVVLNNQSFTWYSDFNINQSNYYSVNQFNNPINTLNHSVLKWNYSELYQIPKCTPTTLYKNSSSDKERTRHTSMDADKYYSISRFGDYSVHFPNKEAIPAQEIEELFSRFGQINSCKQTGDERGLFFVNYKTEEAAKKCVESLRNHPKIKLRLSKQYICKNDKNNHVSESKKYNYPSSPHESNHSSDKDIHKRQCNNDNPRELVNGGAVENENGQMTVLKDQSAMNMNNDADDSSIYVDNELDVKNMTAVNNKCGIIKDEENNQDFTDPVDLPDLIPALKKKMSTSEELKEVIKSTMNMPRETSEIVVAQEIIVANIEDNYGTPAILHLLEKYDPICASPIKLCKPYSIRYCHVYFNNVHQAEAAEREFDEFKWSENKKLIVLRANTLATLALTA